MTWLRRTNLFLNRQGRQVRQETRNECYNRKIPRMWAREKTYPSAFTCVHLRFLYFYFLYFLPLALLATLAVPSDLEIGHQFIYVHASSISKLYPKESAECAQADQRVALGAFGVRARLIRVLSRHNRVVASKTTSNHRLLKD